MRQEKQLLLDQVKDHIEHYKTFVLMRYLGLNANATSSFRRKIAAIGGELEVVKKRILVKAAQSAGIDLDVEQLTGHVGVVLGGTDPVQLSKAVIQLKKDTNEAVDVLGGYFEGQLYSGQDVEKLSALPGKDEMRAQLLGTLEAPMAQTVAVIQSALCSVLYCLENKAKEESNK